MNPHTTLLRLKTSLLLAVVAGTCLGNACGNAIAQPPMVDIAPMPIAEPDEEALRASAFRAIERRLRPRPLRAEEVEGWGAAVDMDPDSMAQLREAIAIYLDSVSAFEVDSTDRFSAQLEATHRWNREHRLFEPLYTPEYLRLLEMQWQTLEHYRSAERDLTAAFLGLTPLEHSARARRLVFGRLFSLVAVPSVRKTASINVAAIVDAMNLSDDHWQMVGPTLDTYVQRMSAALGWRTEAALGLERERVRLLVELGPLWEVVVDEDDRAFAVSELTDIDEAMLRTEIPISGLNEEALRTLQQILPPTQAEQLRRRFWRLVDPELVREELELTTLILESMGDERIAAAEITGREALLEALQANLLQIGFNAADFGDLADSIDPTRSRDDAIRHVSLRRQRLDAVARRREALLGTASSLESMIASDEVVLLGALRTWSVAVRRSDAADRWTADRLAEVAARLAAPPPIRERPEPRDPPDQREHDDRNGDADDAPDRDRNGADDDRNDRGGRNDRSGNAADRRF